MIVTRCASCGARLKIPDQYMHRRIRCGACGNRFTATKQLIDASGGERDSGSGRGQESPAITKYGVPATLPTHLVLAAFCSTAVVFLLGATLIWSLASTRSPSGGSPVGLQIVSAETQVTAVEKSSSPEPASSITPADTSEPTLVLPPAEKPAVELASDRSATKESPSQPEPDTTAIADPIEIALQSVVLVKTQDGFGSGFIYGDPKTVVTNFHVVAGASDASVVFPQGRIANVKGFRFASPEYDIAILQVDQAEADAKPLRHCKTKLRRGDDVFSLGSPKGLAGSASKGSVSAFRTWQEITRSISGDPASSDPSFAADSRWIQTSAPISSGNSGGPLVTDDGEVVGINTWVLLSGQNLNFSLDFGHVVAAYERGLFPARPLASLPKPAAPVSAQLPSKLGPQEVAAVKAYWKSFASAVSGYRTRRASEVRLESSPAGEWPRNSDKRMIETLQKAASEVEAIPTRSAPDVLAAFLLEVSTKMRTAAGCYERICAARPTFQRVPRYSGGGGAGIYAYTYSPRVLQDPGAVLFSPAQESQLLIERSAADRLVAEIEALLGSAAARIKRALEQAIEEDLPPLAATW